MQFIEYPHQKSDKQRVGGKAAALTAMRQTGAVIPAWFVLTPDAFTASLTLRQRELLANAGEAQRQTLINGLIAAPTVQAELDAALAQLCPNGEPVAVRSSAPDEDGERHAFAGQLDSFLNVSPAGVSEKVAAVWRSAFSQRLLAYRCKHGLDARTQPPAVIIQRMVQPNFSGVAFSANPVTGNPDVAVVAAVAGLGESLVSGQQSGDTYHLDRQGEIIQRATAGKPLLTDDQVQAIARLARQAEAHFGRPQDIEWAIAHHSNTTPTTAPENGARAHSSIRPFANSPIRNPHIRNSQLFLLQARPITNLPPQTNDLTIWDNSNIAESYPGVTTPLTFSFARRAYEAVYREFCHLLGVPAAAIQQHDATFKRMLGLIQGRIYYNLLSWHRVLALLPGYKLNRRFMEQMMGVDEPLPDALLDDIAAPSQGDKLRDGLHLLRTLAGLAASYLLLPRRIRAFYARLNRALNEDQPDLTHASPAELAAHYRNLEQQLLTRWDAPLINDFFAMIFYGLLRKLVQRWSNDSHGTLQNSLVAHTGGVISTEPVERLRRMAQTIAAEPAFIDLLCNGARRQITAQLGRQPQFAAQYRAYLAKFGDRCLEELKLESPTLHDDPLPLLRTVGHLAQAGAADSPRRPAAEVASRTTGPPLRSPLRRLVFNWALNNTRRLLRNRENLRFERTRLFGRARQIFLALGQHFHNRGLLNQPRDIFYLEVEEVLGVVEGTATIANLNALAALRRREFDRYRAVPPPPSRLQTRGIPSAAFFTTPPPGRPAQNDSVHMQGQGCSPGLVRGRVRVITNPRQAHLMPGEILVARRTDPGWVMLFSGAAGLLVEHGSLLSHAAIVSRELGLPAIVSLSGVTRWLKTGDWVELDGRSGLVTKMEAAHAGA